MEYSISTYITKALHGTRGTLNPKCGGKQGIVRSFAETTWLLYAQSTSHSFRLCSQNPSASSMSEERAIWMAISLAIDHASALLFSNKGTTNSSLMPHFSLIEMSQRLTEINKIGFPSTESRAPVS